MIESRLYEVIKNTPKPYYNDNGVVIFNSDCRDVLPSLLDNSIDLIITDPPYGINYLSNHRKRDVSVLKRIVGDDTIPLDVISNLKRVLTDRGALYWFTTEDGIGQFNQIVTDLGMVKKRSLIWDKGNWAAGDLDGDYGVQTEYIAWTANGRHLLRGTRLSNLFHVPREVAAKRKVDHPSQKPQSLVGKFIIASSDEGDIVLDPFMGSGSTILAAMKLGRMAIGIEIEKDYCDRLIQRLGQGVLKVSVTPEVKPVLSRIF